MTARPDCEATLRFSSYCGMGNPIFSRSDRATIGQARTIAARILRARRNSGHAVTVMTKGREWECCEPEDCAMIPDTAGTLVLAEVWRCEGCGREAEAGCTLCERCDDARQEWECCDDAQVTK